MQVFKNTHFDFMSKKKYAITVSVLAILIGIGSLISKGGPKYNIDFLGGTEVLVGFKQPLQTKQLRNALNEINLGTAEIKQFGTNKEFVIRVEQQQQGDESVSNKIIDTLKQTFPSDPPALLEVNSIGPKIGQELRESAIWAIIVALGLILLYISIRFDFIFAVGAVVALFHDVLITLGLFSILNLEISLAVVAAFLTLIGYSLNDTIVVYDRIRETLKTRRREVLSIDEIINMSINATLSRTLLTAWTTLIVVIVFLFFGGEVLRDFFVCLLIGIIVGTYSSIFIAAPVVARWYSRHRSAKLRARTATT